MSVADITINLILTNYLIDSIEMDRSVKTFYKILLVYISLKQLQNMYGKL